MIFENDVPAGLANRNRFTRNAGGISYAGEGQQLVGLPAHFFPVHGNAVVEHLINRFARKIR